MAYLIGTFDRFWQDQDLTAIDYFNEPFNDPETIQNWQLTYGSIFRTGQQADHRRPQPAFTQQIVDIINKYLDLHSVGTSYYKMMPGDILPYHSDSYAAYCKHHGVAVDSVWRVVIFMNDWMPGFVFEIEGNPIARYPAGTWVAWQAHAPHMSANLGQEPRYTLQITGTKTFNHVQSS